MSLPKTPSFSLHGKNALITGASSGIGRACAVALATAGAHVTLAARRTEALTALALQIEDGGAKARVLTMDVRDTAAMQESVATAGPFDILINSAGLARHSPSLRTSEEDFDAVADINIKAAYFLTRSVAQGLVDRHRPGSLINISSQMAHVGGVERAVYCATKHAVEGFTKSMAIELGGHGIRVNTICPTFVLTDFTRPTLDDPEKRAWVEGKIKLGRIAEVEDVMGAAVFLASDAASMITGTSLLIDGGWTAE